MISEKTLRASWPLLAATVVLAAALAEMAWPYLRATDGHFVYALDDTYIQMAIAKNLAVHGRWGVTPYEFSGAGTSLLWPWLLALVWRIAGQHDATPFVLNVAASIGVLSVTSAMLAHLRVGRPWQFAILSLIVVAVSLPWLTFIGMEHTLQILIAVTLWAGAVRFCTADDARERSRMFVLTCVSAALAIAVRYDTGSVLFGVLTVVAVTRGWRRAGVIALCGLAPAAMYAAVALSYAWPAVPAPILLKDGFLHLPLTGLQGLLNILGVAALRNLKFNMEAFALVLSAVALMRVPDRGDRSAREIRLGLWVFLIATGVHMQFGETPFPYVRLRYDAYLVALGIVAIGAAAGQSASWSGRPLWPEARIAATAVVAAATLTLLARGYHQKGEAAVLGFEVYRDQYQVARFLRDHPPSGAVMLSDIGAVTYMSDVRLVDALGLASADVMRAMLAGTRDEDTLRRAALAHGVSTAVLREEWLPEWSCAGAWAGDGVSLYGFYDVSPERAAALRDDLAAFEAALPPRLRHGLVAPHRTASGRASCD